MKSYFYEGYSRDLNYFVSKLEHYSDVPPKNESNSYIRIQGGK